MIAYCFGIATLLISFVAGVVSAVRLAWEMYLWWRQHRRKKRKRRRKYPK